MRSWRTALRIARREARRAKGRSTLVIALIGLPVLAVSFAAVSYDSFRLTPAQQWERQYGAADAMVSWWYDGPAEQNPDLTYSSGEASRASPATGAELLAILPPGSRLVPYERSWVELRTAAGVGSIGAQAMDLTDPIFDGLVALREGRPPAADREVALTGRAAQRLDATIGDEIQLADGSAAYSVVAIVEFPSSLGEQLVFGPGALPTDPERGAIRALHDQSWLWAAPEPVTWEQVRQLNQHGIVVASRAVQLDPPPPAEVGLDFGDGADAGPELAIGALIAGLALLEVVLLAGPAFAVSARRRQRDLALVAANGGTPADQRRIVLADGVVLGLAGAAAGITLGVGLALASLPLLEIHLMGRRAGGVRLFPLALVGAAGLAVLTGLLAALVPAAVAARQQVVAALAGRRGVARARKRWLVLGLAIAGLGAALAGAGAWQVQTGLVLTGLVLVQLGLVLCTPALVGLVARAGRLAPLAPRIALRDTARNRAAAAPAISAVMAAVTGALALGMYLTASDARRDGVYQLGLPIGTAAITYEVWDEDGTRQLSDEDRELARAALAQTLPAAQILEVRAPTCPPGAEEEECWVQVPVPDERRCPAEDLLRQRVTENGGSVSSRDVLTAQEQRAAREDPRCQDVASGWSVHLGTGLVDDGTALPALVGGDAGDLAAATEVLRAGGIVVTDPNRVVDGEATLTVSHWQAGGETAHQLTVPGYALTSGVTAPFVVLSPAALDRAGLVAEPYALVATNPTVPDQAQQDALRAALSDIHPNLHPMVETGPFTSEDPFLLILAAVAGVVALAAAAIATGLAAADRRGDLSTLAAVGAAPRVRRLLSLSQAGVVAGLGALLGTLAGLGSATAVLVALRQSEARRWPVELPPYELAVPWLVVGFLLVVVPGVAMLGAGLLTRSRLPIERRLG